MFEGERSGTEVRLGMEIEAVVLVRRGMVVVVVKRVCGRH